MTGLSRSTYYSRAKRGIEKAKVDADLRGRLEELALSFPRYGYRRMTAQLHREGWRVNHKRVLRLMRESDLLCKIKRRFVRTTDSAHGLPVYPNLVRGLLPSRVNQIWVADITYIRVLTGFAFLAAILDAFSRRVVGWAISRQLTSELTCAALKAAFEARRPPRGLIHHSDRGVQYASREYVALAEEYGMQISMSRKGNPYENPIVESFFKTLKTEEVYLMDVGSFDELRLRLPEYIDVVYNMKRLHSSLGYLPPAEFEAMRTFTTTPHQHVLTTAEICPI
jgi:putative transposase